MGERWVVNASPLIALARAGHADWLAALCDEVVVPAAVRGEVLAGPLDAAAQVLAGDSFAVVDTPAPSPALAGWDLGAGETAVLAWAESRPGWTAVLDDRAARRCAAGLGVPVLGTLSVVARARLRGLTPSAADVLRVIRANGFRIDDAVVAPFLLAAVGEEWSA